MNKYPIVAIDDGHGMETPGKRTPPIADMGYRQIHENYFNRGVASKLDTLLRQSGLRTLLVAPTDYDTSLIERTNAANKYKADIYVAIHFNAYDGTFSGADPSGMSLHIYPGSKQGRKLAECIHKYLIKGTEQVDRGIIESNFHVLRETAMPAVLSENGYMDNYREAHLMVSEDYQWEVATEHAKGICDYLNVEFIDPSHPNKLLDDIDDAISAADLDAEVSDKELARYLLDKFNDIFFDD